MRLEVLLDKAVEEYISKKGFYEQKFASLIMTDSNYPIIILVEIYRRFGKQGLMELCGRESEIRQIVDSASRSDDMNSLNAAFAIAVATASDLVKNRLSDLRRLYSNVKSIRDRELAVLALLSLKFVYMIALRDIGELYGKRVAALVPLFLAEVLYYALDGLTVLEWLSSMEM